MKIDTEHLHYWMNAIRTSPNHMRTLDAFWRGQISSKEWLIAELRKYLQSNSEIEIHGGWVGVLSSMLFQAFDTIEHITSIDIDASCQSTAEEMNRIELNAGKFLAVTANMNTIISDCNVVINTSCEHLSSEDFYRWLNNRSPQQLLVLQSNNYDIPEHVRLAQSLSDFVRQCNLSTVLYSGELKLPLYNRYMLIGCK